MPEVSNLSCSVCGASNNWQSNFCTQCGARLNPVAQDSTIISIDSLSQPESIPRNRNGCLATYLVLIIVLGGLGIIIFFVSPLAQNAPNRELTFIALVICGLGYVASGLGLWHWKRWGFDLFAITASSLAIVVFLANSSFTAIFTSLIQILFLYVLLQPYWKQLE